VNVRFLVAGDTAVVAEFGDRVDRDLSARVLQLAARVNASGIAGVCETIPTYRSLMVLHDPLEIDTAALIARLRTLLDAPGTAAVQTKLWRIPACYERAYAPDLEEVAARTRLPAEEVVTLHSAAVFHVYMVGFVPGFPYMGDLPAPLELPRRVDPRVKVPAGSIAIAARQTAIYPLESPGGWHLIGSTPVRLFDVRSARPALLAPGDKVRFDPIGASEFEDIRSAVEADAYTVPFEMLSERL
jgi:KipI family sensor histidine kinase inhibitor